MTSEYSHEATHETRSLVKAEPPGRAEKLCR